MGRPRRSALLPLLRSDAEARVLAAILLSHESMHVRALADQTRLSYSVVQREVDRLERAGLVGSQRIAGSRVVRPNENHPLFAELRALLLKAYGPQYVLGEILSEEGGVSEAFIYGSWAARYDGEWGPAPADIDVLLIGTVERRRAEELEAEAEDRLGQPVQIEVVPPDEWREPRAPFTRTLKRRPLVPVLTAGE